MGIYTIARQQAAPLVLVLAAFGLFALNNMARAQNAPNEQNAPAAQETTPAQNASTDEVTVAAPAREVVRRAVGRTRTTARVEDVTISHQIDFKDLDLKKADDVAELNRRVRTAAEESCAELDRLFPSTRSRRGNRDCVNRAIGAATAQVTAAVSGSGGRYGNEGRP